MSWKLEELSKERIQQHPKHALSGMNRKRPSQRNPWSDNAQSLNGLLYDKRPPKQRHKRPDIRVKFNGNHNHEFGLHVAIC